MINESAFENCNSLVGIDGNESAGVIAFSDKLRKIKDYAFSGCSKIAQVTIPYSVTYIGWNAFNCVGLNTVYFNSPICTMYDDGYAPFAGTNLKTVIFGKNVTSIPENVCSNARSLQGATFEGRVTQIGNGAFKNCTGLSEIILTAYFED